MECRKENRDGVIVLVVDGAIDHETATAFEQAVMPSLDEAEAAGTGVVFDLSGVDYMSSVGLRVLMLAAKAAKQKSISVVVAGLQPSLAEFFQISRFDKIFTIYETADAAVSGVRG
jgi:anti-anti-sigma factor